MEWRTERAANSGGRFSKQQAGNVGLGMEASAREQPLRASERPLRETGPRREKVAASQGALIRRLEKTVIGERIGETPGPLDCQCSVPCMPAMGRAGNQVTWNHFLFQAPLE